MTTAWLWLRASWAGRGAASVSPVHAAEAATTRPLSDAVTPGAVRPVGIRRGGPGRRATDQAAHPPSPGLAADLAALRRGAAPAAAAAPAPWPGTEPRPAVPRRVFAGCMRSEADPSRRDQPHNGRLMPGDEAFLEGVRLAQIAESTPRSLWALYLLGLIVVSTLVWASLAKVDVVTRADGKVVPEAREQVIASLEGGILRAVHVREGAIVEAGEDLVQLDPTRFAAQQNEGQARQVAMRGTVARLTAEAYNRPLSFPPEVRVDGAVVAAETDAYNARRHLLDEAVSAIRRNLGLIDSELATAQQMADRGLMSDVEVMRLRRQRNDLLMQMQERANRFRQDASTELLKMRSELAQIGEQQVVKDDALRRTTLRAPLRGIVKNIRIGTIGGVVAPGAPILEIVPITDRVLVEARIKPADIGFVRTGLAAEIKLSAYDYYTYGGLKGTIEYISPDALGDDKAGGQDNSYYRARIRTDVSRLRGAADRPLTVLPGMTASVEIRTGDRTVMDFLLKPIFKGSEAFRER